MKRIDDIVLVRDCERRIVNAWPAPATLVMGDWVVRFANGYSGRANSASALREGAELDAETLELIEDLYRAEGLPPCLRATPLVGPATRELARARGYRLKDASRGLIAALGPDAAFADPQILVEARPTPAWIAGVCALQAPAKSNAAHLAAIVETIRLPAAFATLYVEATPIAFGMSVCERGMAEIGSVVVDPLRRGHGHGRRIVRGLLGWAAAKGARHAYLQVEQGNTAAEALYETLGFAELYAYETLIREE